MKKNKKNKKKKKKKKEKKKRTRETAKEIRREKWERWWKLCVCVCERARVREREEVDYRTDRVTRKRKATLLSEMIRETGYNEWQLNLPLVPAVQFDRPIASRATYTLSIVPIHELSFSFGWSSLMKE